VLEAHCGAFGSGIELGGGDLGRDPHERALCTCERHSGQIDGV
jgi:hypothetical protein